MSDAVDLVELVARADAGDATAFTQLVSRLEREWRFIAATFCGSQAQVDAALRCAVVVLRNALGEAPPDDKAFGAWVQDLLLRLTDRLLTLALRPGSGDDGLTRLAATKGLDALRRDPAAAIAASHAVAAQVRALPETDLQLLKQRYTARQVTADTLLELARLRARLIGAAEVEAGHESAWENALASSNGTVRDQILADITDDATRLALEHQLRTHLLLGVLLTPPDEARTQQLSTTVGFSPETAYPEASRGATQDGGTQITAQVTFSIHEQQPRKPGTRGNRPAVRASTRRPPESVAMPMDPPTSDPAIGEGGEEDFDRSQRTTNYLMWGTIAVIAIAATLAFTWQNQSTAVPEGPQVKEAAVGIATVIAVEGRALEILPDRQRRPARNGAVLLPGEGLVVSDPTSFVTIRMEGVGQFTTRNETVIHSIVTDPQDAQATLINLNQGTLDIDALAPRANGTLSVNTNNGRMVSPRMAGEVTATGDTMTVTVRDGEARLSGIEDPRQVAITGGLKATTNQNGRAVLDAPRRFMRGINCGGDATAIAGQGWLSQDQAMKNGMAIVAGDVKRGGCPATSRLDVALRSMLDCGLGSDTGLVVLTQKLPPALWEAELWIVNDQGGAGQGVTMAIDGRKIPVGQPLLLGPVWRVIGPFGFVAHGDQAELRLAGLAPGDRLAGLAFRLVGKAPDDLGPAFAAIPPWSAATDLGGLLAQTWDQLKGNTLASLQNDPRYPNNAVRESLITTGRIPMLQESWTGHRLVGFLHPPVTGDYTFNIVSDGTAELLLSTDDQHLNVRRIARVPRSVQPDEWTQHREQSSAPIHLVAGERYALEVVHRQGERTTHLGIGWRRPDGTEERPIPGSCLSPLRQPQAR